MAAQSINGLLLVCALLALHSLVMQVSAITCYEGFGPRKQVIDNSTVKLREGELLVLHCITNSDVHKSLDMPSCCTPEGLTAPGINTTGFCKITETYTSIVIHGILKNQMDNLETLLEFDVETYNLEQCLAQANTRVTPSPCTTPPHSTDPAINTSTTPTISTTETIMTTSTETPTTTSAITTASTDATDPSDTRDPIETTVPEFINVGRIQQNCTTADVENEEINQYLIYYGVIGVLCVMVLVQFLVIVLLVVFCRKRRQKVVEEGETGTGQRHEMRRISQLSLDKSVIVNTGSVNGEEAPMDNSRERVEGEKVEGATGTDQRQETRRVSRPSYNAAVITDRASVEGETITNVLSEETKKEEGVETCTKKQQEEEEEDNQHSSDVIKETATANGGTCSIGAKERDIISGGSIGAKERDIASGGSVDSVNDSTPTTKPC